MYKMGIFNQCSFMLLAWLQFALLCSAVVNKEDYFARRSQMEQEDFSRMLGSDLVLTDEESAVNEILMDFKNTEMQHGYKTLNFIPSQSFLLVRNQINKSPVFAFIKEMPKGAALHLHESGLASVEWVVSELTYWEDLYMCQDKNQLTLRFFDVPDNSSCSTWRLVSDVRANYSDPKEFDKFLMRSLTILTDDPDQWKDQAAVWDAFESAFTAMEGLMTYMPAWKKYIAQFLNEFMNDNVLYIEWNGIFVPLYEKNGTTYNAIETFEICKKVVNSFISENKDDFFGARYIYAAYKGITIEELWKEVNTVINLKASFPDLIAGFNIVGYEDRMEPLKKFIGPLLHLSNQNPPIPVFYLAGETNWSGMESDENIFDALLLNSSRLTNAYAITKHPSAVEAARAANVPVEVCPIANQVLMLVKDLRNHPMASLVADGFPIVVSSDDPAMWGADPLSHDFYEAFYALGGAKADLRFLKKLALNSIYYSSLEEIQKQALQNQWQNKWDSFINSTLNKFNKTVSKPQSSSGQDVTSIYLYRLNLIGVIPFFISLFLCLNVSLP